jgi:hypothetical protein
MGKTNSSSLVGKFRTEVSRFIPGDEDESDTGIVSAIISHVGKLRRRPVSLLEADVNPGSVVSSCPGGLDLSPWLHLQSLRGHRMWAGVGRGFPPTPVFCSC